MNFLLRKQFWLDVAEVLDAYRIFPRTFVMAYGGLAFVMHQWYTAIDYPTTEQTAYATSIIGLCVPLVGWYMGTGRKWQ